MTAVASTSASALASLRAPALRSLTSSLSPHRYALHYDRVLASDLLYMTYDHSPAPSTLIDPRIRKADQLEWDATNPYTRNRPQKQPRGKRPLLPAAQQIKPDTLVKLEKITLDTFVKEASSSKAQVLSAIAGFQAMTGEQAPGFASDDYPRQNGEVEGIQVVRTGKASASFKVRSGQVCGAKVTLRDEAMWTFLETLVDLVLPRLKDWNGVRLPPPSTNRKSPSMTSGVVGFGLPPQAMALFPAMEINLEQYPRLHGFNINFVTNAKGPGAQDQARALLSGFRIPFIAA